MNSFSIRDIENLCGIKAHTLRVWEQRYQLVSPKRKPGNHRYYDAEDLKHLLRISWLYHLGHKPSHLAQLSEEQIRTLAQWTPQTPNAHEAFIDQLLESSLDFDTDTFTRIQNTVIGHMGFEKTVTRVLFPFLQKIGLLCLTGTLVPAQEHFASALITR